MSPRTLLGFVAAFSVVMCAPDAWDELASCFAEAAARFKRDNNGRPPVLVIDGAELLMLNKPFVDALLTTFKVGSNS